MILFIILAFILVLIVGITIAVVATLGAGTIIIFSDVIVCAGIIAFVMYLIIKRKRGP